MKGKPGSENSIRRSARRNKRSSIEFLLPGKPALIMLADREHEYVIRRSRRAKHLLLHVDIAGRIEVVMPWYATYKEAQWFVEQKRIWLGEQLRAQAARRLHIPIRALISGTILPCFGNEVSLSVALRAGRTATQSQHDVLAITAANATSVRRAVEAWYREQARTFFTQHTHALGKEIGILPERIRITGARTHWGSCNPRRRTLSFTWRLALGPVGAARYVAIHEAAHLCHAGHTKSFWRLVEQLEPDYQMHRQYLREQGYILEL